MSIRHLVVAALLASAGAAQADVVSTASQPTFVNGWTANGANIIGSGVLGSDVSLVGGIAHSTGNSAALTTALAGNTSAYMSASDAQRLFVQQGIDASYLLSAGNGLLAARYGNSTSVINDGDGVKIVVGANPGVGAVLPAVPGVGGAIGGGDAVGGGGAIGGGGVIGGGTGGNAGGSTGGGNATQPGSGTGGGNVALPAADPIISLPDQIAAVPEPGTVALMLAGLVGAGSLSRRRSKR